MIIINKLALVAIVSSLTFAQTVTAETVDLVSKVKACSQISDNKSRLTCFDALSNASRTVETSKPIPTVNSSVSEQAIDEFAKSHVQKTEEEEAKEVTTITLTISKLSKTVRDQWKISFVNGQKWQQKDSTRLKLTEGARVILTKGALGAVYLQKENSNKRIKVKRLK